MNIVKELSSKIYAEYVRACSSNNEIFHPNKISILIEKFLKENDLVIYQCHFDYAKENKDIHFGETDLDIGKENEFDNRRFEQ